MVNDCFFCQVYSDKVGIIYENKHFYSRFDRYPVAPGHAEVIPKRHIVSLRDLAKTEWNDLLSSLEEIVNIIESYPLKYFYKELSTEAEYVDRSFEWSGLLMKNFGDDKSREYARQMLTHVGIGKKPDGYNIGINEGEAAGRTVNHLHVHVIPRYLGDVEDPRGGVRYVIPKLANYKK